PEPPGSVSTARSQLVGKLSTGCRYSASTAGPSLPGHEDLDRRLDTGRPRLLGAKGAADRPQEPVALGLRRARRVQRLGALDDRGDQSRQRRDHAVAARAVLADG